MTELPEIEKTIIDSRKRLLNIEKTDRDINNYMDIMQLRWKTNIGDFEKEAKVMHLTMEEIQDNFKKDMNYFLHMITKFKNTGTAEQMTKITQKINEQNFESNVTRMEFKKMVLLKLKEYLP